MFPSAGIIRFTAPPIEIFNLIILMAKPIEFVIVVDINATDPEILLNT